MLLAIYGAGGFGREIAAFARRRGEVTFVSDAETELGTQVNGLPVVALSSLHGRADCRVVIAVADAAVRRALATRCEAIGLAAGSLIADSHERGDNVTIGEGAIFCGSTICTADARIGVHFHANIYSYVAHDCVIGDFVTLAPRVCINGNTIVEDDVYIGSGAILRQGSRDKPLRIGRGAVIGMGAVVTKDVAPGDTVIGSPARSMVR